MFNALKKLLKLHTAKKRIHFVFLVFMMIIGAVLDAIGVGGIPAFIMALSDPQIIQNNEWGEIFIEIFSINDDKSLIIWASVLLIVVFVVKNSYLIYLNLIKYRFIKSLQVNLSKKLFSMYMKAPYTFHLKKNSSELLRNVSTEVDNVYTSVFMPFLDILMEAIMALGILVLLFAVEPVISLIIFGVFSLTSFIFLNFTRNKIKKFGEKALQLRKNMIFYVNKGLGGLKEIKVLNREQFFINQFAKTAAKNALFAQRRTFISFVSKPYIEIISIISLLLISIVLLLQERNMSVIIPVLVLFGSATIRLLPSIKTIVKDYSNIKYYLSSIDVIYQDIDILEKYSKAGVEQYPHIDFQSHIEICHLNYHYPESEKQVLNDINLTINRGKVIGFVGSSGSGKTTLIDILLGLLEPDSGEIIIDVKTKLNSTQLKYLNIGYIPQNIYLSDDSVKNNIAFGIEAADIDTERLKNAVQMAQLSELIESLPQKIDTIIGENGIRLSGGQRQRIGIARALYNNPDILIMDEATSALDNITEKLFMQSIEKLFGKITIIIIAHRLTTVKRCDTIYFLKNGSISAAGTYDELLKTNPDFLEIATA